MILVVILKCNSKLSFFINPYFHNLQLAPPGFYYAKRNSVSVSSLEAFSQIPDLINKTITYNLEMTHKNIF